VERRREGKRQRKEKSKRARGRLLCLFKKVCLSLFISRHSPSALSDKRDSNRLRRFGSRSEKPRGKMLRERGASSSVVGNAVLRRFTNREREREREGERMCVYVCVCVFEREIVDSVGHWLKISNFSLSPLFLPLSSFPRVFFNGSPRRVRWLG